MDEDPDVVFSAEEGVNLKGGHAENVDDRGLGRMAGGRQ
jgi:hypothetical protein